MHQDTLSAPSSTPTGTQAPYAITPLAPRGLGYGDGGISYEARLASVNARDLESAVRSVQILTPVDTSPSGQMLDDDGCGDGRKVVSVQEGKVLHSRSLNRAKVFGGGATMVTAALIGLGKAESNSLHNVFQAALKQLQSLQIGYGAHTDNHHTDPNTCGCGAIDKAPLVLQTIVKYEQQIMGTLLALDANTGGIDEVMAAFRHYAEEIANDTTYAGRAIADDIINSGVVVKDLGDEHKEMYIVLNNIQGMTVNQEYIRSVSEGEAQVFGVDVWRMEDLSRRAFPGDPVVAHKAFLSELVYTLGVAATLTKGDLPVYAANPA